MFRTSNPTLKNNVFGPAQTWDGFHGSPAAGAAAAKLERPRAAARPGAMTLQGTVNKSFFLLALCVTTAVVGWELTIPRELADGSIVTRMNPMVVTWGGLLVGLVLGLITTFRPKSAPVTAPLYALAEGFFVGGVSALYASWAGSMKSPGVFMADPSIVLQAALCTFGTFGAMLTAYSMRLIKPTQRFRSVVITATAGVMVLYVASILLRLVGLNIPFLHEASPLGIAISGVIIIIAALNLILDFDYIESGVKNGAPKYGEWYGGFTMLVTLVWLYVEFLRLLWMIRALADE